MYVWIGSILEARFCLVLLSKALRPQTGFQMHLSLAKITTSIHLLLFCYLFTYMHLFSFIYVSVYLFTFTYLMK